MSAEFRSLLENMDVAGLRRAWHKIAPGAPQPKSDREVIATAHVARTLTETLGLKLRAYSHRWCLDNGIPSQLPDVLKPTAERMYPRAVESVGISVNFAPGLADAEGFVRGHMEQSVIESYDKKILDTSIIRSRMMDAKLIGMKKAFGRFYRPGVPAR